MSQVPHVNVNGDEILQTFGFDLDTYWHDIRMLVLLVVAFLGTTFLLLQRLKHGSVSDS